MTNKNIPGEALIYENVDGVIYARYRNPPYNKIERWIIGGDANAVARAQGQLLGYADWQDLMRVAQENPTLKLQLDKLLNIYYLIKDQESE